MHPTIIIGTVRLLWTWRWGRYHVPQNIYLVNSIIQSLNCSFNDTIFVAATNTADNGRTQPLTAPRNASSHNDTTLIDNDLYE